MWEDDCFFKKRSRKWGERWNFPLFCSCMFSKWTSSEDAPFCSGQEPVCYREQKKPGGIYTNSEDFVPSFCQLKLGLPLILTKDILLLLWLGTECAILSQCHATADAGWEKRPSNGVENTATKTLDSLGCWKPFAWSPGSLKAAGSAPIEFSAARILPYIFILIYEKLSHRGI